MDKIQLSKDLKQIDARINGVIESVNYAKVHHKSIAVIVSCGNAASSLMDIQKKLSEIALQLGQEGNAISESLNKNAVKIDGVIENVNYAKVHYKSTAAITSCGYAVQELNEIRKDLAVIETQLGSSIEQHNGPELEEMGA